MRSLVEIANLWRETKRARRRFLRRAWIEDVVIELLLPQLTAGLRRAPTDRDYATPAGRLGSLPPMVDEH